MKTEQVKRMRPRCGNTAPWRSSTIAAAALLLAAISVSAAPEVTTLTEVPYFTHPNYYGQVDGATSVSRFHTPIGVAVDSTGQFLFVADRDNNAVREIKLALNQTLTFVPNPVSPASLLNRPVGVAVDRDRNVYVLNGGDPATTSANGSVVKFDRFGNLLSTIATGLVSPAGIALDPGGNIYLTVQTNTVIRISLTGERSTVATIPTAGTWLQGLVVKRNGWLAVCDAGLHGVYLINPANGAVMPHTGFNGVGDYTGLNNQGASSHTAKFNRPNGVAESGDGSLVVADYANHRVKVVQPDGVVTNLYGVGSSYWVGPLNPSANTFPGWWDGTVTNIDIIGTVEARQPCGVVFAPDGTVYTTETYYHVIRKVTSTGLALPPPPPPPVPSPQIGWVSFPYPTFLSVLNVGSSFVFNNDVIIAIRGESGSQTFYTAGPTPVVGSIPDPSPLAGSTPPFYADGLPAGSVFDLGIARHPDLTIKAVGTKNDGSPNSPIVEARFQFVTGSPTIVGDNAALFYLSNITVGAEMWYTWDGSEPTNAPPSVGPILNGAVLSTNIPAGGGLTFKARAFRNRYLPSSVVTKVFSATNFLANRISFGFAGGEASSDFIGSPGQTFYAPVTLSVLEGATLYSLQFNVTATNLVGPAVAPGAVGFESKLVKPIPGVSPRVFERIPPAMFLTASDPPPGNRIFLFDGMEFMDMRFTNGANNVLGVGWLERYGKTNLYNTILQDLITYSMAHDTMFESKYGKVVVGGYGFQVPANAQSGDTYQIQIGRPTATSDGIGAPGALVYLEAPTSGSLSNGAINSIKHVKVGQRKYVVGDVHDFRWFNAGDFGNGALENADVMQVFQSAVYGLNYPLRGSDLEDAMDACGRAVPSAPNWGQLVTEAASSGYLTSNDLFDGNDTDINRVLFGDGVLDVADLYVTFRRSLDPSLFWYQRFWTNGMRAAVRATNDFGLHASSPPVATSPLPEPSENSGSGESPAVQFVAGDALAGANQLLQIPITAHIQGEYPLRVLMLSLTVESLEGSPALAQAVEFTPAAALGAPTMKGSAGVQSYAAAWLNPRIGGLTGTARIGTLSIRIPANASPTAAYAVRFEHISSSPNGLAVFPQQLQPGLITLSDRSGSSLGDGIADAWRLRYFGSVGTILAWVDADADGDGHSNRAEYKTGTNPNDSLSVLRVLSKRPAEAGTFVVRWPSVAGRQYVIERSGKLSGGTWSSLGTYTGTGWDMEFSDPDVSNTPRFYRVRMAE